MIIKSNLINNLKKIALAISVSSMIYQGGAMAQSNGITPVDVLKIQSVGTSQISEDGKTIAYSVSQPVDPFEENKSAGSSLYIHNVENGKSIPYYTSGSASAVKFRPGKESITFLSASDKTKKTVLYEISLRGGAPVELFAFDRSILSYTWHPNGDKIAFTSNDEPEESDSKLPYQAVVFEENRPYRKGFIANISGSKDPIEVKVDGSLYMLKWSPKGDKLAVTVAPSPEVDDFYMAQALKVVDPTTGNVNAEMNNKGKIGQIVWSPDGSQIAIKAGADLHDPIDGRILTVAATGGNPKIIDKDFKGKYEQIEWTDKGIFFLASKGVSKLVGSIQPDGSKKVAFFESDELAIRSVSFSAEQISMVANTPTHPNELFIMANSKKGEPKRLTFHNEWLKDRALGKQEIITYPARDGKYEIQGILIYPVGYEEGSRVPMITVVHGGPESHYSNGWLTAYSMPGQMAAVEGYAVFYPNYRGSTGRGIDFIYSSQADMSGKEFDDVVDGVDYLIEKGIADKERVGVTGGSYGGYASAWMSTYYSDRFAASVMFVGISNNLSKWGTSDIPNELFYVHSRERMWESDDMWMNYLKRSPIYYVDRSETPILIMHGENDTRVHPAQALELHRHIKVRKPEVPVRLVLYPEEGHGNRKASAQLDYALRMMQWFDTYLMTGDNKAEMPNWDVPMPE